MSDLIPNTPAEQVVTPPQQVAGTPPPTPAGDNWKARYDGLVIKVQELSLANQTLTGQLAQQSSVVEQLKAQLSIKDTEKSVAVGERDTRLQTALTENTTLTSELNSLRALKMQVEVANELGHPELMQIASSLPMMTDKEAMKTVMSSLSDFTAQQVKARETQLMSGMTPGVGGGGSAPAAPSTQASWLERINSLQLGSKDRQKAMDDYGDFLERQHNSKV